jgi:methionyl-tRNA formyltransferase
MKSIFVSFDEIGWRCLEEILRLGGDVAGIFTLDDERRLRMSGNRPFDDLAAAYNVPLFKVRNINDEETLRLVGKCSPDISFVIGWSQLVGKEFISSAAYTCVGMHPTLLPRHRGRAPLTWAVIMGLEKTGVTMFHIDVEADNGDIIGQAEIPIEFEDDAMSLYKKALDAHVALVRECFPLLQRGEAPRIRQDASKASYWQKRTPADGIIDWNTRARNLYDWIRALSEPYPGAFTFHGDGKLMVWKAAIVEGAPEGAPGAIIGSDGEGLLVAAGDGTLRLTSVQFDGGPRLSGAEIIKSKLFAKGTVLG